MPQQEIIGRDRFEKGSNELRIASPSTDRFRFVAGLFQERQTHWIIQDYQIQGFGPQVAVTGWPNTIWLTDQNRIDRDEAAFVEANFDITPNLTLTGGIRGYHYRNTLVGFYGYSANYSSHTGEAICIAGADIPQRAMRRHQQDRSGSGETHKVNLSYKFDGDRMVYATYSTGFRPGGVNRNGGGKLPPYGADTLDNYEVGWKTRWFDRSLTFNGAVYDEEWNKLPVLLPGPEQPDHRAERAGSADHRRRVELRVAGDAAVHSLGGRSLQPRGADQELLRRRSSHWHRRRHLRRRDAQAVHGQQLPYTPSFKGNLTGRYTFPVGPWTAHAQASVVYQTSSFVGLRTSDNCGDHQCAGRGHRLGPRQDPRLRHGRLLPRRRAGSHQRGAVRQERLRRAGTTQPLHALYDSVCGSSYPAAGVNAALYVVPIQPLTLASKLGETF